MAPSTKKKISKKNDIGQMDALSFLHSLNDDDETMNLPSAVASDSEAEGESDQDEEATHKQEMESLAKTDPAFHAHLQREAKDLLEFGESASEEEEEEEEEGEEEEAEEEVEEEPSISLDEIIKLEVKAERGDNAATRKLIKAFRRMTKSSVAVKNLSSPECVDRLVSVSIDKIAIGLDLLLWPIAKGEEGKNKKVSANRQPESSQFFKAHAEKIKDMLGALSKSFGSSSTSPSVLKSLLLSCRSFVTYFSCSKFKKEAQFFLNALISVWAKQGTSEIDGACRVASYFRIRQLCRSKPATGDALLEHALKNCYTAFARGATTFTTPESRERIGVQVRCLVDLYGANPTLSYRVAFGYVRQLALHVRAAMASKTQESLQSVCSWQFVHCLRLWGFVFAEHHPTFTELEFPLIQVALGVLGLVSTARYTPLKLHCVDVVNRLCRRSGTFSPVATPLLQTLSLADLLAKKTIPSTEKPPDLDMLLKFKADALKKANARSVLVPRVVDSLRYHLMTHRTSVAFPELWFPIRIDLIKGEFASKDFHGNGAAGSGGSRKNKHVNKKMRKVSGISGEADAWKTRAISAVDALIRDADRWARLVKDAREGRVPDVRRPGGPSDLDGCSKFEKYLVTVFESDADKAKDQMHNSLDVIMDSAVVEEDGTVLDRVVPSKGKVNKAVFKSATAAAASEDDNDDEVENDEEGTRALDPRKFMF